MLLLEDLHLEVAGKEVIQELNMEVKEGETVVLFGPNGSGKTSLVMTIMGFPEYKITKGKVVFKGQVINSLSVVEGARLGIWLFFQRPPTVRGLKMKQMV